MSPINTTENENYVEDELLMKRSVKFTNLLLSWELSVDTVDKMIKQYQTEYLYLKKDSPEMVSAFTPLVWLKTLN